MIIKKVKYFVTENGSSPFEDWLNKLDNMAQAIVVRFVQRVAQGGAKKSIKALKDGIFEIKITHGPGYRVYFAEDGNEIIILLVGGDKKTQSRDIECKISPSLTTPISRSLTTWISGGLTI